jgi:hypothetical protein
MPDESLEPVKNITPVEKIKKVTAKQIVVGAVGLLVLVGGLGLAVILVRQRQIFREKAYTLINYPNDTCNLVRVGITEQTPCTRLNINGPGQNNITNYTVIYTITNITAQSHTVTYYKNSNFCTEPYGVMSGENLGCWAALEGETVSVTLQPEEVTTIPISRSSPSGQSCGSIQTDLRIDAVDGNPDCKSNYTPGAPIAASVCQTGNVCVEVSGQCLNIKAFDTSWNPLSASQLLTLKVGDAIRFTVAGQATAGTFDKARFTINGTLRPEVTQTRPGSDPTEFYDEYTIPPGVTSFTITAEVHHSTLGWF